MNLNSPKQQYLDREKRELTYCLESGFPITMYETVFGLKTYGYVTWHWHDEFQLCFVKEGSVLFQVEDTSYLAKAGEGVFINSKVLHMAKLAQGISAEYLCVEFPASFLTADTRSDLYRSYILPVLECSHLKARHLSPNRAEERPILQTIQKMWQCYDGKAAYYELELYQHLMLLWKQLLTAFPVQIPSAGKPLATPRLRRMMAFIHREYMNDISLDDIADSVHISRSECCRFFRNETGQTLFDYLIQYRILQSLKLLEQEDLKIAEVASAVGFCDQSYFSACFKKQQGVTPNQYRKLNQKKRS